MINKKLSFVGNSGVKFGSQSDGKPYEAAIIDNDSFDAMAGGINVGHFVDHNYPGPSGGTDDKPDDIYVPDYEGEPFYEVEPLNTLMTGVEYGGRYERMTDTGMTVPTDAAGFLATHKTNLARTNGHMRLVLGRDTLNTFRVQIFLDGEISPSYDEVIATSVGKFSFQSHWGSGVIFSNMKIGGL